MRLLMANEGIDDAGGVHTYLRCVAAALRARGHQVGFLHYNRHTAGSCPPADPTFGVLDSGLDNAIAAAAAWRPDVVFSHNMKPLDVDAALLRHWPVVKMMHGYFGTCISGQKAFGFPAHSPCTKQFDGRCLAYFLPRRCGVADPLEMVRQYRWAREQQRMLTEYAAIVVASEHMRVEYLRNGAPAGRLWSIPLFAPPELTPAVPVPHEEPRVLFLGRMTNLKGGDVLVRAVGIASRKLGRRVSLTMAGDGPARRHWEALARHAGVHADFTGWVGPTRRAELLQTATVLAVPSVWPEPFGLVGLEAATAGVPAIAFDVGGVREWLRDGRNGTLVPPPTSADRLGRAIVEVCGNSARREALAAGARSVASEMTLDRHVDTLVATVLRPACRHVQIA
jgi:glycosyltransferase involved in cell wall biosynthesis